MSLLLENARILVPAENGYDTLNCACLGIEGDTIDYIGTVRPEKHYTQTKNMTGKLLIPGLINTHTHSPMTLLRGVGSDLSLQEWLFEKVFPIEDRLTAEDIRVGTELAMLEMLACGTTSFSDMYFFPETTAEAVLRAGMKANVCRPVQSFDPKEKGPDSTRVREALALYDAYHGAGEGRILVDFCVHAEYTCTEEVTGYLAGFVKERDGNLHVHLSETEKEHRECLEKYGKTPARWFYDLGAFDAHAFCAHCVWVTEEDMALFREKGVSVVHNPTSNMKLGSGFAPVQTMLERGIAVGLGTDGAASNNNLNMLEEMHLAAVLHNGFTGDPTIMKPQTILRMATENGARIQGRADTGALRVGMKADLAAISLDAPHLVPNLNDLALICYAAQASDIAMTMVNGSILYEDGIYHTLDRERILREASETVNRLFA